MVKHWLKRYIFVGQSAGYISIKCLSGMPESLFFLISFYCCDLKHGRKKYGNNGIIFLLGRTTCSDTGESAVYVDKSGFYQLRKWY